MNNRFRAFFAAGLIAFAILVIAVGLVRYTVALLSPTHLISFVALVVAYLLPSALALYRNSTATGWITALNILLGWTLFGWFIALGWAAGGKTRVQPVATSTQHIRPVQQH
jgi:hypothetical protein